MNDISLKDVLLLLFGGGLITAIVAAGKFISDRVDQKRKDRKEELAQHTSNAIENQKLRNEQINRNSDEVWKLVDEYKQRLDKLEEEKKNLENSLSQSTTRKFYSGLRQIRRQIDILKVMCAKDEDKHAKIIEQIEKIEKEFDELEKNLP